jgi:hypothetical protein
MTLAKMPIPGPMGLATDNRPFLEFVSELASRATLPGLVFHLCHGIRISLAVHESGSNSEQAATHRKRLASNVLIVSVAKVPLV